MLRMRVSYEKDEELEKLKRMLGKNIIKLHAPKENKGKFKRVFIFFK
ncbi:hypothetical protein [Anaerosporobacter sp.]|nr:hypothetical protein [Anaerosporobacter sp.]